MTSFRSIGAAAFGLCLALLTLPLAAATAAIAAPVERNKVID